MAFTTSSGYGNLPSGNFAPEIFSQKVLKFFRRASVVEDITNTDYAGEIENFGDTVRIIKEPTVSVTAYQRGSVVNPQDLADDQITMVVDNANAFAFKIDDIEERQSHVNFEALATSSGAYALKKSYDFNVLNAMNDGAATIDGTLGVAGTAISGNTGDEIANYISTAARVLDDNDVPGENRWLCASPQFYELLRQADSKIMDSSVTGGTSNLFNGQVTDRKIHGFTLYQTNVMTVGSVGSDAANTFGPSGTATEADVLFGHMSAVATASHIAKTEVIRDPDSFSDIVRGLHVFGRKVLRGSATGTGYKGVFTGVVGL